VRLCSFLRRMLPHLEQTDYVGGRRGQEREGGAPAAAGSAAVLRSAVSPALPRSHPPAPVMPLP
jgi:hypothetical protein